MIEGRNEMRKDETKKGVQVSSGLKTEIEMVVRRSEMRGHPGKEVGYPQTRWMMGVCSTALLQVGKTVFV